MAALDLNDELASAREHGDRYWNWKIPVHGALADSSARQRARREAAQSVIDAAAGLLKSRDAALEAHGPIGEDGFNRLVAVVAVPELFASEVCLYLDRDYFDAHLVNGAGDQGRRPLQGRSLAGEWDLDLPDGFGERGVLLEYAGGGEEEPHRCEYWYFGEL